MKVYVLLLLFAVECWSVQWKAVDDFKGTFKEYSTAAVNTISSIENLLDSSKKQSDIFLTETYLNNPAVVSVNGMKSSKDNCFAKFIDKENLKISFQIQIYQLQIPLLNRVVDIRERLNDVNLAIEMYQGLAESKFGSCKSPNGSCLEETDEWLRSIFNSISCTIYPNCSDHSIRKRSTCSTDEFSCKNDACVPSYYFCDGECSCEDCSDEPADCVRVCSEFRCRQTYRCVSLSKQCNGFDDCGDGSDEDGCPSPTPTTRSFTHDNCSISAGDFLCGPEKCIILEKVCDGYNDCGDWSDEGDHCDSPRCSPECSKKGGVCFTEPEGTRCLYECPPGTYETSKGCSRSPEAPLPTLLQVLEDTPRLITRYWTRLKFLKTKTVMAFSKSLREIVKCKQKEFTLLSKIVDFSTIIHEEKSIIENENAPITSMTPKTKELRVKPVTPEASVDDIASTLGEFPTEAPYKEDIMTKD